MAREVKMDARRFELASDRYRPAYHYLPPANWMNDPNGTIYWKGRYHLFYQYNPLGAYWHDPYWGHAVSDDLAYWTDLPPALAPEPGGADEEGCFSGPALVDREGVPTAIYYGNPHGVCIATSQDDMLVEWRKSPKNPVIPHPTHGEEYQVFDPCAWLEGDVYYALTGGITPRRTKGRPSDGKDIAYLFRSSDLEQWEYMHPFYEGGQFTEGGEDCAVPQFFPLGRKHVLLFASHSRGAQCYIGTYCDHMFYPERHVRFGFTGTGRVGTFCEALTLQDGTGRRILFGRLSEGRYDYVQRASGWAGVLALPMILRLSAEGDMLVEPAPDLQVLRGSHKRIDEVDLTGVSSVRLSEIIGDRLEIRAVFEWGEAEEFGLSVRCSPDEEEQTLIRLNTNPWRRDGPPSGLPSVRELILDVSRSSANPGVCNREAQQCLVDIEYGQPVELRVFLDRSVVEVFVGSRHYLAKRIYPLRPDSLGIRAFAKGGSAILRSLDLWEMKSVWPTE